jgi:hypothetical protein
VLSDFDVNSARKVAVVNQTLVTKYFPNENPIGRMVRLKALENMRDAPVKDAIFEIVGVTSDAKNQGVQDPPLPEMMISYTVTGGVRSRHPGPHDGSAHVPAHPGSPYHLERRSAHRPDLHRHGFRIFGAILLRRTAVQPGAAVGVRRAWCS